MEKLNGNTKKAQVLIENYLNSYMSDLDDAYEFHHSRAKDNAWDYCEGLRQACNGYGAKVCTASKFVFTYGARVGEHDLLYITPSHDYLIENAF